jgi:hypothetical protein
MEITTKIKINMSKQIIILSMQELTNWSPKGFKIGAIAILDSCAISRDINYSLQFAEEYEVVKAFPKNGDIAVRNDNGKLSILHECFFKKNRRQTIDTQDS